MGKPIAKAPGEKTPAKPLTLQQAQEIVVLLGLGCIVVGVACWDYRAGLIVAGVIAAGSGCYGLFLGRTDKDAP